MKDRLAQLKEVNFCISISISTVVSNDYDISTYLYSAMYIMDQGVGMFLSLGWFPPSIFFFTWSVYISFARVYVVYYSKKKKKG